MNEAMRIICPGSKWSYCAHFSFPCRQIPSRCTWTHTLLLHCITFCRCDVFVLHHASLFSRQNISCPSSSSELAKLSLNHSNFSINSNFLWLSLKFFHVINVCHSWFALVWCEASIRLSSSSSNPPLNKCNVCSKWLSMTWSLGAIDMLNWCQHDLMWSRSLTNSSCVGAVQSPRLEQNMLNALSKSANSFLHSHHESSISFASIVLLLSLSMLPFNLSNK